LMRLAAQADRPPGGAVTGHFSSQTTENFSIAGAAVNVP